MLLNSNLIKKIILVYVFKGSSGRLEVAKPDGGYTTPVVRVTLASMDEAHSLLQNGLDFYGATFFPTELGDSTHLAKAQSRKHQTLR